ncbi:MAG: hypothetical protein ACI9IP_002991 [Arcticibacterium sp.]|jgi:hypothetical protein
MIDFDKHLKELLYEEDFLIIPGIGAFIAVFTSASLSESGDLISPHKTFEFNGLLTSDDSHKFLNYLFKKENLEKEVVEKLLKEYLYKFKSQVNPNNPAILGNILSAKKTGAGHLEGKFTSTEDFYTKPEFQNTFTSAVSNTVPTYETLQQNVEEIGPEAKSEAYNEYTAELENEDYEDQEDKPWIRYMLYLLPLFFIFGALYYVMLYKPFQKEAVVTQVEETVGNNDLFIETDTLTEDSTYVDAEVVDKNAVIQEIKKDLKKGKYQVSAGLFKNRSNAEKLVSRMKASGFEAEIKVVSGMRRVIVAVNSIDEAEAMSNRIEQFTGDKSVYFDEYGVSNK